MTFKQRNEIRNRSARRGRSLLSAAPCMTRLSEIKAKQTAEVNRKRRSIFFFARALTTGTADAIWLTGIDLDCIHGEPQTFSLHFSPNGFIRHSQGQVKSVFRFAF